MKFSKLLVASLALAGSVFAHADGVEWSGFGSFYYAQTFDQNSLPTQFVNNKMDFSHFSSLGLNLSSKVSDRITFYSQIIATGEEAQSTNFNMYAQWGFLNVKLTDNSYLKLGRQLFPALMSGEYSRVHYLLPSSHLPMAVTSANPFISLDGASYNYDFQTSFGKLNFGAYTGSPQFNQASTQVTPTLTGAIGAQINLEGNGWKLHASGTDWKESLDFSSTGVFSAFGTGKKVHAHLFTLGGRYDKNNIVIWSELVKRTSTDAAVLSNGKKLLEKVNGGYVLAGYRFGSLLARATYSTIISHMGFAESNYKTYDVGFNYTLTEQSVLKVDYEKIDSPQSGSIATKKSNSVFAGVDFIF
jgi:hypothetical protein